MCPVLEPGIRFFSPNQGVFFFSLLDPGPDRGTVELRVATWAAAKPIG